MITRKQYMADSHSLHHAYYLQLAGMSRLGAHDLPVSIEEIREALKTDEHLNNIPLYRWDACARSVERQMRPAVTKAEEYPAGPGNTVWSLSDGVCALKALAKHLATQNPPGWQEVDGVQLPSVDGWADR